MTGSKLTWERLKAEVFDDADIQCVYGLSPMSWPEEDFDDNIPDWERCWTMTVRDEAGDPGQLHEVLILGASKLSLLFLRPAPPDASN
jgi:hypothetical protein